MGIRRPRHAGLAAALAAVAALAAPAAASADYTAAVAGDTVTLNGNDDADALNLGVDDSGRLTHNRGPAPGAGDPGFESSLDFDSAAPGVQEVVAAGKTVVVNASGGDDAVTFATAGAVTAVVDGGAGNDVLTGADLADQLRGGDGNDRIVGARGGDDVEGGAGNDTLVWNNGDGSDVMDGDAGNDAVEVNGAVTQGDVFTIKPAGARVRFDRTNLGPFNLDIGTTERMEVNGLGGADTITGDQGLGALLLTLSGGAGADTITGGDGADLLLGGEEADTLSGAAGDDRIVGERGDDTMSGGAGDDTLVWNNGDGSDRMDGDDGADTIEVNGAVAAGDAFTVVPNGARTKFDRTNLGPFTLDIAAEALDVRGIGGNDTLTVAVGTPIAVTAAGGSGDDVLSGGPRRDVLDGGTGNDRIEARDGGEDLVRCGDGADTAVADAAGTDALDACETIDRPAPAAADTLATPLQVLSRRVTLTRRGRSLLARIRVACPAAEAGGCRSRLSLFARARLASGGRADALLARRRIELRAGQRATVTLRLPARVARLARRGRISARAETLTRDAAGNAAEGTRRLTLRVR